METPQVATDLYENTHISRVCPQRRVVVLTYFGHTHFLAVLGSVCTSVCAGKVCTHTHTHTKSAVYVCKRCLLRRVWVGRFPGIKFQARNELPICVLVPVNVQVGQRKTWARKGLLIKSLIRPVPLACWLLSPPLHYPPTEGEGASKSFFVSVTVCVCGGWELQVMKGPTLENEDVRTALCKHQLFRQLARGEQMSHRIGYRIS